MGHVADQSSRFKTLYTTERQQQILVAILCVGLSIPALTTEYLSPLVTLFPIVLATGVFLIRTGRPRAIPTWVVFNAFSFFIIVYGSYSIGTELPTKYLVLFLIGLLVYDIVGVRGGQIQSMNSTMLKHGLPVILLLPHSPAFSFDRFREIMGDEGHEALHGSDQGCTMLGIGDGVMPGALAVSVGGVGTALQYGIISVTLPQIGAVLGGVLGLATLMRINPSRPIAALMFSVPGALLGLGIGIYLEPLLL